MVPGRESPVRQRQERGRDGRNKVVPMSRTLILAFAAICWAGVAADGIVHLVSGDVVIPAGMALAFVVWATLWRRHYGSQPAQVRIPVEA